MTSPEVIDFTLSDDEIQPDPIRSDQEPLRLPEQQIGSEQVPQHPPTSVINRRYFCCHGMC